MKKTLALLLAAAMTLSLAACGGGNNDAPPSNTDKSASPSTPSASETTLPQEHATEKNPASQGAPMEIKPAENGTLTIGLGNAVIMVNGTAVPMPYRLAELEAAGVPADESRREIELAPGDFFSVNLYLDENEDYLLSPAYYNEGDDTVNIADAQAEANRWIKVFPFSASHSAWQRAMSGRCSANRCMTMATILNGR